MSRHITIDERAAEMPLDTNDLNLAISVDGKTVTVQEATKEEFDIYIYELLFQMYDKKGHALNRYETSFWEHDYAELSHRLKALNKLRMLNEQHTNAPLCKTRVPLFVEEQVHA